MYWKIIETLIIRTHQCSIETKSKSVFMKLASSYLFQLVFFHGVWLEYAFSTCFRRSILIEVWPAKLNLLYFDCYILWIFMYWKIAIFIRKLSMQNNSLEKIGAYSSRIDQICFHGACFKSFLKSFVQWIDREGREWKLVEQNIRYYRLSRREIGIPLYLFHDISDMVFIISHYLKLHL